MRITQYNITLSGYSYTVRLYESQSLLHCSTRCYSSVLVTVYFMSFSVGVILIRTLSTRYVIVQYFSYSERYFSTLLRLRTSLQRECEVTITSSNVLVFLKCYSSGKRRVQWRVENRGDAIRRAGRLCDGCHKGLLIN